MEQRLLFPEDPKGPVDNPTVCREPTMTRQSEVAAADVNEIMKRYEKTGVFPVDGREAAFTDVSTVGSYRDALEVVQRATEGFMALPAAVRERFGNDAVTFVDMVSGGVLAPEELLELGLVEKAAEPPVVAPEAPGAA